MGLPLRWRRASVTQVGASIPVRGDDALYWFDGEATCALDPADGALRWSHASQDMAPTLVLAGPHLVVCGGAKTRVLDRRTGAPTHEALDAALSAAPMAEGIALLLGRPRAPSSTLVRLDATLREIARVPLAAGAWQLVTHDDDVLVAFENAVERYGPEGRRFRSDGLLLGVSAGGILVRDRRGWTLLDADSGLPRWSLPAPPEARGRTRRRARPALDRELVVWVDPVDGSARAHAITTGDALWATPPDAGVFSSESAMPTAAGVLVIDERGRPTLLGREDGAVLARGTLRTQSALAPCVADDERVYVVHERALGMELRAFALELADDASERAPRRGRASPSVAPLMRAWLEAFAARSDVRAELSFAPGVGDDIDLDRMLPPDLAAFAREQLSMSLTWTFTSGEPGGRAKLDLAPVIDAERFIPVRGSSLRLSALVEQARRFDDAGAESAGLAFARPRQRFLAIAFGRALDDQVTPFASFTEYLARGARTAFATGWQTGDASALVTIERLRARSTDETSPSRLAAELVRRGVAADTAKRLVDWLGPEVGLAIPRDEAV